MSNPRIRHALLGTLILSLASCGGNKPPDDKAKTGAKTEEPSTDPTPTEPSVTEPSATTITPKSIPPGFDFPAQRADIEAWIAGGELTKIREHGWHVWAGMTADSGEMHSSINLPIWDTWLGDEQLFTTQTPAPMTSPARAFKPPTQANHGGATPSQVVSFNKFNPAMATYLSTAHPGPGGASFEYTQATSLAALNQAFDNESAKPIDRTVVQAPYVPPSSGGQGEAAMETKPVFNLVKATGLTAVPLWRGYSGTAVTSGAITQKQTTSAHLACTGAPASTQQTDGPAPSTWTNCVILDPANTGPSDTALVPATPEQIKQAQQNAAVNGTQSCSTYSYAPLSVIYNFAMSAAEAAAFASAQRNKQAAAGDFAVLVAMHVNTKETINWTWQTFWWQPDDSVPASDCSYDQGDVTVNAPGATGCPGSKSDMTSDVVDEWRNYAMCTAYAEPNVTKPSELTVCYNPFLETHGTPSGVSSNCMSCHGIGTVNSTARSVPGLSYPVPYAKPIGFGTNTPLDSGPLNACFNSVTRTDFSWAIPFEAAKP
ncbi:hypothetical protein ENSA5_58530 [Enhygromyxa salina]|uniref:Uncharacterized protein n=1 Tax=Enhygromyxa salina TaxID=215803 RepID=A0A2S9XE26_9BACT|nr:hypothetical protein [Enhygromyxa salina]PRP91116.1 hypothetical protein ENSA5_58530 [Enhygromyxa salina]